MKKLLDRDKIFEWLNPVLDAGTFGQGFNPACSNIQEPASSSLTQVSGLECAFDLIDNPPAWLDPDSENYGASGNKEAIGAMFINGVPVSQWSGLYAGSQYQYNKTNIMSNWYEMTTFLHSIVKDYTDKIGYDKDEEVILTDITIIKIAPSNSGNSINMYIKFKYNDLELFGKWVNWGLENTLGYQFICQPLKDNIHEELWIKITGKLKKIISEFLKPKAGIYKMITKELVIYSELGQISRLHKNDIIEVIWSDNNKIKFNYKDKKWQINTPVYWWFNWYFDKIK